MPTTLIISDLHTPFEHEDALDFLRDLKREYKPDFVVNIGDETDQHGWSRHDPDPDAPGPKDELRLARKTLTRLRRLFPSMRVCTSNHGDRAARAAMRVRMPNEFLKALRDVYRAPGWEWRDEWVVDGVRYIHGEGFAGINAARNAALKNWCNTVIGHVHSHAGIQFLSNGRKTIWGMNVGCLVDVKSVGLRYGRKYPDKPVLGTGVVVDGQPIFIPMGA